MEEYPAKKLTVMALHWLRERYPNALLTTELAVAKYGEASLDAAAIMPDQIVGVEVKGDGDSPSRLERQGFSYSRSATRMLLLPAPSIHGRIVKRRPKGWGLLMPDGNALNCRLEAKDKLPNAPAALLDILWKEELLVVAKTLNINAKRRETCCRIANNVAELAPLGKIRSAVCEILYNRNWDRFYGFGKVVYRPESELPKI